MLVLVSWLASRETYEASGLKVARVQILPQKAKTKNATHNKREAINY